MALTGKIAGRKLQHELHLTESDLVRRWQTLQKQVVDKIEPPSPDPRVRRASRKQLTSLLIADFIHNVSREEITGASTDRYRYRLKVPTEVHIRQKILNPIVKRRVMQSARVQTLEVKGVMFIERLFDMLIEKPTEIFPDDRRSEVLTCLKNQDNNAIARLACDYVSGMTDTFAENFYSRLFVPGFGSVHDLL